jgi:CheY-like chemotaxis protein
MADAWNVLVIDDDKDIHLVTKLALSRFTWKDKKLKLTSAYTGREAREILSTSTELFEVALVDVVMESDDAGLQLCKFIRELPTRKTRIILRTGQPGNAPEPKVMQEYAIDYYLSKGQATPEQMAAVIRGCLQASEDIRELEERK